MANQSHPTPGNSAHRPSSVSGQPSPLSSVRGRVLRHLRRLLPKTAIAGAALHLSGCDVTSPPIVCDPLPPPVDCSADLTTEYLYQWVSWQARWVQREDNLVIEMLVNLPSQNLTFAGDPQLEGATLVDMTPGETALIFVCSPEAGATTVNVAVPLNCDSTGTALHIVLDISGTPEANAFIPATIGA